MAIEMATETKQEAVRRFIDELAAAERHCSRFPTTESIQRVVAATKRVHEATAACVGPTGVGQTFRGPRLVLGPVARSTQHNSQWQIESGFDMSHMDQ